MASELLDLVRRQELELAVLRRRNGEMRAALEAAVAGDLRGASVALSTPVGYSRHSYLSRVVMAVQRLAAAKAGQQRGAYEELLAAWEEYDRYYESWWQEHEARSERAREARR